MASLAGFAYGCYRGVAQHNSEVTQGQQRPVLGPELRFDLCLLAGHPAVSFSGLSRLTVPFTATYL